jgi:hypothetical protein
MLRGEPRRGSHTFASGAARIQTAPPKIQFTETELTDKHNDHFVVPEGGWLDTHLRAYRKTHHT